MIEEKEMKDALQFFLENNLHPAEVIKRGFKQGLNEGQTRMGMIRVYERVKGGEKIKPLRLAWQAWEEAKRVQGDEFMALESDKESLRVRADDAHKRSQWAVVVGGVGWITAIIFIVQYFWGVLWT